MTLNLYHISQTTVSGYDTYSDAVVAAASEQDAKRIHPCTTWWDDINNPHQHKHIPLIEDDNTWYPNDWINDPNLVTATLIGTADPSITEEKVICASYHAG